MFSENFRPKSYDYYDYMDVWYFTFYFRPFDHSWFFHWGDEIKNENDFPNWFQEWWLFFGATHDILCPQIKEGFSYFVEHGSHLLPAPCSRVMFFLSKFQIPWILCWDFVLIHMIPAPFPAHLARKFKVTWWSSFTPSNAQQLPAIHQWISGKNISPKPFDLPPIPTDVLLLSQTAFPYDKEYIKHLRLLKKKASETLSQFSGSGYDDDDTASSTFLRDVNEDMCHGFPYTPLG